MKWILIVLNLGYSYGTGGSSTSCVINGAGACSTIGTSVTIPSNKQESEPMDRDSCFKAAETVKKAYPQASISCEVRNPQ